MTKNVTGDVAVDYIALMGDIEPTIKYDFSHWAVIREMRGTLSADDYDELRDR